MLVTESIDDLREQVKEWKRQKLKVGFVPTMGALHEGHLSLIELAHKRADRVVVSIFVNPEQFSPDEDYDSYPRKREADLEACKENRVDAVFIPSVAEIYPDEDFLEIRVKGLGDHMCGASRPGFFEGVLLVVNKLFNIVNPDIAVFGQKDIQQYRIVSRMAEEFNHDVKILKGEIIRANDGLALSSRNSYLSDEERLLAPSLYRSLKYLEKQIRGGVSEPGLLIEHQKSELEAKGFEIDYLDLFSFKDLKPVKKLEGGREYILAGAVYLGETRLIDNILIDN